MGNVALASDSARNPDGDRPSVGEKAFVGGICGLRCIEEDGNGGELPVCEKSVAGY